MSDGQWWRRSCIPPPPLLHLALQRSQPVAKVENHCNARQICSQVTSEPLDHAQPRNAGRIKKPLRTRTCAGLEQTILHEICNERRMHSGARRQALKRQLLGLDTAEGHARMRLTHCRLSFHPLAWIEARSCCELFKQGALAFRQGWRIDQRQSDVLIAASAAAALHPLATQAQPLSALRASRDRHVYRTLDGGYPDLSAERRFPGCHWQL